MADQNTSLPIRSQTDGTDERLHVKIVDGTTSPAVNQVQVDSDNNLHVEIHGNDPAGVDQIVRTSETGALTPDGLYHVTDNSKPGNVGLIASSRDAAPADSTQTERLTSIENAAGNKRALDVSIHDEAGEIFSDANPLPVYLANDPGAEIQNYDTAVNIAANATSNHDYLVATGQKFELYQVLAAASGKMRIEVQYTLDNFATAGVPVAVRFNSTASPDADMELAKALVLTGNLLLVKVRVIRKNLDNQAQDVYSTIVGILK